MMDHRRESPEQVFVCISSERARDRVERAIRVIGVEASDISHAQLRSGGHGPMRSLVYDLCPWTPAAAATLVGLMETNPELRVLLYVPVRADSLEMLPRFAGFKGISTKIQSFSVVTFGLLCGLLRRLDSGDVDAVCERAVTSALPDLPPSMREMLRVAGSSIAGMRPSTGPLNVAQLAGELGVSSRTLARKLAAAGLPPPKEFLDWMLLVYVEDRATREGCPHFTVARRLGCDSNAFYRVRKRRLGTAAPDSLCSPDLVRDMFVNRCRSLGQIVSPITPRDHHIEPDSINLLCAPHLVYRPTARRPGNTARSPGGDCVEVRTTSLTTRRRQWRSRRCPAESLS